MPDNDWLSILIVVLGSTALSTLINVVLTPYVKKTEWRWDREARIEGANMDTLIRQQKAHEDAKAVFVPLATEVFRFVDQVCYQALGNDVGVYDPEGTPLHPESQAGENLWKLRRLWSEHPTKEIRSKAQNVYDDMANQFGEIRPGEAQFPTGEDRDRKTLLRWREEVSNLIESLHAHKKISGGHLVNE